MARQYTSETVIFATVNINDSAVPSLCGICNSNPPTFAYRFGQFSNGSRTGHCCTPCACRWLMDTAERAAKSAH
jgi:formate dehydrogenase maturation protein FdhE